MAQLLPGAVVVFALTCVYLKFYSPPIYGNSIIKACSIIKAFGNCWFSTSFYTVLFLLIATGIGMLIHGLNWAVSSWVECKCPKHLIVRRDWLIHKYSLWLQLLLAPIFMIVEIIWMLSTKTLLPFLMDENVVNIPSNKMQQFTFLQDFYLYFGQFYAHTGYAFLACTLCCLFCFVLDLSLSLFLMTILTYLLTSIFFLLGRIELGTLFKAESQLVEKKDDQR